MRKLIPILLAGFLLLVLALPAGTWKWRTHGGVYGSRGIAVVAHERLAGDPNPTVASTVGNLKFEIIRPGSIRPDTWRQQPYYADRPHVMTYVENQGGEWLLKIPGAQAAGAWDNVSYYLGIAAHYWADVTCYAHHDNARSYFEKLYGNEIGYQVWDSYHDRLEGQAGYYRPKDPALIINPATNLPYADLPTFIAAAKAQLDILIYQTMRDSDNVENGWFGDWIADRKCEASDYSVYHDGNVDNVHYGSKELVDMATELVYSGWVYALGIQNSVSADRITWSRWWSREHREPGVVYISF